MERRPQSFSRVLSSMCTEPHPSAREAAERYLATNPGDPGTFPAVADLEREAIAVLGEVTGLEKAHGYIASGGTEANIQAVHAARNLASTATPNVVVPESAHFSFHKAASLLGVEVRVAPTVAHRADVDAVAELVDDETALLVGVAGSTEYGRVDPIVELAEVADASDAHLHVDAAWGGFALPFTDERWHFDHAPIDSMTVDPHKLGQAAIPAGGLLVRDDAVLDALAIETPYLVSASQATLLGTRSGAGVASAAAALEALWPDGYRAEFERAIGLADWLADELGRRGHAVVEPVLPLVAASIDTSTFDALRRRGWRISRTASGELRVVVMPHVDRPMLEAFLADLDEVTETVPEQH
ncbi:MAG: tyrosine decarboxylase MfnA [Halobacteriota archaeon]